MPEENILEEALRITSGERLEQSGAPEVNFARIAALWSPIIGVTISPRTVALCMIALKISRAVHSVKRDHWTDIAGYAHCGNLVEEAAR